MNDELAQSEQIFSPEEARVLACLMEKEMLTPNNYPLTVNSLTLACNQKSNREPVMKLSEGEVGNTVNRLVERDWARIDYGERAHRISHHVNRLLNLDRKEQAIMTVLLLRLPQTLNEIRVRTQRMARFDGPEEILVLLDALTERTPALVKCLAKGPGQREDRYAHLLCGDVDIPPPEHSLPLSPTGESSRLDLLEERLAALEEQVGRLLDRLGDA